MPKVVILGGGVAGMSAAHELVERGFEVEVFETKEKYVGGKARSVNIPNTASGGRLPLPGEHGFRFFPGFYRHVTDTMKRIPYKNPTTGKPNKNGVFDNLVAVSRCMIARYNKLPIYGLTRFPSSLSDLKTVFYDLFNAHSDLTRDDLDFFALRIWQLLTSCKQRRIDEYERLGWWEFLDADNHSDAYRQLLVIGLTRSLVAAQARVDNVRTCGDIFLQLLFNMLDPATSADRVLNGPTNDVWLNPWYEYLTAKGVRYHKHARCVGLQCNNRELSGAWVSFEGKGAVLVTGDYYICAMPVEAFNKILSKEVLNLDPALESVQQLSQNVEWMNGIQYFLTEEVNINQGHILMVDTEWALTALSQVQFWKDFDISKYGDGSIKSIISVDISDWKTKGENQHPANECNSVQIKDEVWNQMEKSLNVNGTQIIDKSWVKHWHLDGDIHFAKNGTLSDKEPLLVNLVHTWTLRPEAYTNIQNLCLASDYVKTNTDIATMEAANEAARRAVNCIIDRSGVKAPYCSVWDLHEPWWLAPYRWRDQARYAKGLSWHPYLPWWSKLAVGALKLFSPLLRLLKPAHPATSTHSL